MFYQPVSTYVCQTIYKREEFYAVWTFCKEICKDLVILVSYVGLITNQEFNPYWESYLERLDYNKVTYFIKNKIFISNVE